MNINRLETNIEIYKNSSELNKEDQDLLRASKRASENAYAPYSEFKVGAAALMDNGDIVLGNNQENASFPAGICAERVALFSASAQNPGNHIVSIAISSSGRKTDKSPAAPCGVCRQAIAEYEHRFKVPIRLILSNDSDEIIVVPKAGELLPLGFNPDYLI